MVDIAQLVSASDCGSEGRGFESHYPPHKKNRYLSVSVLFILGGYGIRRERPDHREGKKVSGGHFFSSGENPWAGDPSRRDVGICPFFGTFPKSEPLGNGLPRQSADRLAMTGEYFFCFSSIF